jgi:integrase
MGNAKGTRRRFGAVRQLRSGRWQARCMGPDGIMRPADQTFVTKTEAERWLTRAEAEILDGDWIDPDAGRVPFGEYAADWIAERPSLRPHTIRLYRYLLRDHLHPGFGDLPLNRITDARVRRWRKELLDSGVSPVTTAKAYRLLKAVMNTAVSDGLIRRNPCRLKGAGQEHSAERPVLSIAQVMDLAEAIDPRFRVFLLLAVFGSLRWGELAALRRCDVDVETGTVRISRQLTEQAGGRPTFGPPKSAAGQRTVIIPAAIIPDLAWHLARFAAPGEEGLLFTSSTGSPLHHSNFYRRVWMPALRKTGLSGAHFHDLRHSGNLLAAAAGATLRELMARMGHSSTRAALIYLHDSDERQRKLAQALGEAALAEFQRRGSRRESGTDLARDDHSAG